MPLHYVYSKSLAGLYAPFSRQLHAERQRLLPQTPQTIVVGNLDTESYLQNRLIEEDGVLMGVNFPFLEGAIENFSLRCRHRIYPKSNESWFSVPATVTDSQRSFSLLDLEIGLLGILQNPQQAGLLKQLGYDSGQLTPARIGVLAQKLAGEWYDYLLHIPGVVQSLRANGAPGALWNVLQQTLKEAGFLSPHLGNQQAEAAPEPDSAQAGLFLFGMPMLSAYHLRALSEIARTVQVTVYATDFADLRNSPDSLIATVGQKYAAYRETLALTAKAVDIALTITDAGSANNLMPRVQIAALPGLWRAAEIIGDICHGKITDSDLRQTDISIAIHNLDAQYAAFEKSLGMRTLTATCRATALKAPDASVELWKILVTAAGSGIDRDVLLRYWQNPVTRDALQLTDEDIDLFRLAIERAQGFRSDYQAAFAAYSFGSAKARLARAAFFHETSGRQQGLRLLDSLRQTDVLLQSIDQLTSIASRLGREQGNNLLASMQEITHSAIFANHAGRLQIGEILLRIGQIPGSQYLNLKQIVAIIENAVQGADLRYNPSADGITFTSPVATAYGRPLQVLFDLNDKISTPDDRPYMLPEFRAAPTRLNTDEQLVIAMVHAIFGGSKEVILAYSNIDAKTGAEFYPAQVLARFEKSLQVIGIEVSHLSGFSPTVIDTAASKTTTAADDDILTLNHVVFGSGKQKHALTDLLMPRETAQSGGNALTLKELYAFLKNPAIHVLAQRVALPEEPAEFRYAEPALASANSSKAVFCEDFFNEAMGFRELRQTPFDFVLTRQTRGEMPAGGFDHATRLLAKSENAERLSKFTTEAIAKYRRIDVILANRIESPFVKSDGMGIERCYFPAINLQGFTISGQCEGLYLDSETGQVLRLVSATKKRRLPAILELHLLHCLLDYAGLEIPGAESLHFSELTFSAKKNDPDRLEFNIKNNCEVALPDFNCEAYLLKLIQARTNAEIFWFDLESLTTTVFANLAALSEKALIDSHETDSEFSRRPAKSVFLKRFFDLSADRRSYDFFDQHLRPLAVANATVNAQKPKAAKRGKK